MKGGLLFVLMIFITCICLVGHLLQDGYRHIWQFAGAIIDDVGSMKKQGPRKTKGLCALPFAAPALSLQTLSSTDAASAVTETGSVRPLPLLPKQSREQQSRRVQEAS